MLWRRMRSIEKESSLAEDDESGGEQKCARDLLLGNCCSFANQPRSRNDARRQRIQRIHANPIQPRSFTNRGSQCAPQR